MNEQDLRIQFLASGVCTARQLAARLGVSQPTISRALARMAGVLRIGRGPAACYGLEDPIGDLGASWPLYLMDREGAPEQVGRLHRLAGGPWWLESAEKWPCLIPEGLSVFPGLPWFLDDVRPQGFLGRAFARRHGRELGQEIDPALWSNTAVAESLLRFGRDLPGAFVLGREALARAMDGGEAFVTTPEDRPRNYLHFASAILGGEVTGSSAGGEQPKFAAAIAGPDRPRHVLVKFSPPMAQPEGRRWADLLFAERTAHRILAEQGFAVPQTEILDSGDRRFLQEDRFDRTAQGRVPVVSLRAVDAAFFGLLHTPWADAAHRLQQSGWLDAKDAVRLAQLGAFGRLIHNTDMHYGNASVILSRRLPTSLAPVYDMLPMGYRPGLEGQIPGLSAPALAALGVAAESPERRWAAAFWDTIAHSEMVSPEFRTIARAHRDAVES